MKNKQPALRMYADRALVLPWVSGHYDRYKIGGFVVQGILRFTNQYYHSVGLYADWTKIMIFPHP